MAYFVRLVNKTRFSSLKYRAFSSLSTLKNNSHDVFLERVSNSNCLDEPSFVHSFIEHKISRGENNAFYVVDLNTIRQQHDLWKKNLPRVHPFYAVKCNPDPEIIRTLASLGAGFDCASQPEIEQALNIGNVAPDKIVYANPCKQASHLQYASNKKVSYMTFDTVDELYKIKQINSNAKLILRLWVDDDGQAQCPLGSKFGATLVEVPTLIECAKKLSLDVIGFSFHVGSGCYNVQTYMDAVENSKKGFEIAHQYGFQPYLLDIGGGFPGHESNHPSFTAIAKSINNALDMYFPLLDGQSSGDPVKPMSRPKDGSVRIIAEPGRYYAAKSHTLVVNVIGRKSPSKLYPTNEGDEEYRYFINDGVYGSFNCLLYDHAEVHPVALLPKSQQSRRVPCSIWGPTCDGLDKITNNGFLPVLEVGQWMYFANMGAYTAAAGSNFNGFELPKKYYLSDRLCISDTMSSQLFSHGTRLSKIYA